MANILKTEKKVAVVSMLAEGASMASVARITGIHLDTIMRLAVRIGQACAKIQDEKMRNLACNQIEVDEIWGFIGAKRKNAARVGAYGDVWTFIALDADSKRIPSFIVGKRDAYHAKAFMEDLAGRLSRRVQISSDALNSYPEAVEKGFGSEVDYGQLVKTYAVVNLNQAAASRYSPAEVVKAERTIIAGMPDVSRITTSHVEKQNHTLRMHCRRLTRLTNAFSKKFDNFQAAVALNFAYYNFCKTHKSLRMTPAQAQASKAARGQLKNSLNVVANKSDYIARLQVAVSQLHNCGAVWRQSVPIREVFHGTTLWEGDVEMFDLNGHPKAQRCYGWTHGEPEEFITILELPPVTDAQSAVKVGVSYQIKKARVK